METIYITNDPWRARVADEAGVDRVLVDLEIRGKIERQKNSDTVISRHSVSDIAALRSVLRHARLMVRVNPLYELSGDEIDKCIGAGADTLMLPMFACAREVRRFVDIVSGRAKTSVLLETGGALARIHDVVAVGGIDEAHIGLNDLHLALGLDFMFEIVSGGLVDYMAGVLRGQGLPFGVGGVARVGKGLLSAALILSEHIRLGSSRVILSRDFNQIFAEHSREASGAAFRHEVAELHNCVKRFEEQGSEVLEANRRQLRIAVAAIRGGDQSIDSATFAAVGGQASGSGR